MDVFGSWSPDDRWIAFLRYPPEEMAAYFLVPAVGGVTLKLVETHFPMPHEVGGNPISWFPDGKRLLVTRKGSSHDPLSLFLLSVELDEQWKLTDPPADSFGDADPAVSPDGRVIVFKRMTSYDVGNLYLLELTNDLKPRGPPVQLTFDGRGAEGLVWTPDGHEIIFAAIGNLWRLEISGGRAGRPERLPFTQRLVSHPVISSDGQRLAYCQKNSLSDILRVELSDPATAAGPPARFISSTRSELHPEYSPDGKRIAFVTNRSGRPEIWTCDSDGSNLLRLVPKLGWTSEFRLNWSPDGEWIAFTSIQDGNRDVWVVRAEGGVLKRLTSEPSQDVSGSWSHDGKWIYFTSDRGGEPGIWKIPSAGGEPVRIAKEEAWAVVESSEAEKLYYLKPREPNHSLWKIRLENGEKTRILDSVFRGNYTVEEEGIYFIPRHDPDFRCYHLQYLDFASGQIKTVLDVEVPSWGFSVSPDGHSLLYGEYTDFDSDIMLVENFR
jgi:Tol biopolymer transport system component